MSVSEMFYSENELPVYTKERARIGQVLNLFGGVEVSHVVNLFCLFQLWSQSILSTTRSEGFS